MKSWSGGVPNNGLVFRATNELDRGRDIRFASNAMLDCSKQAKIEVRCLSERESNLSLTVSSVTASHTSPEPSVICSHLKPNTNVGDNGAEASTVRDQISHSTPYHHNSLSSAVRQIASKFDDQSEYQYVLSSSSVHSSARIFIFGFIVSNVGFLV